MGIEFQLNYILTLREVEREQIAFVMAHFDRNIDEAAFALGVSHRGLEDKCKRYGIELKPGSRKAREYKFVSRTPVECTYCEKKFPISSWYYKRRLREGQRRFYCTPEHQRLYQFKKREEDNKLKYITLRCANCEIDFPRTQASYLHRRAKGQQIFCCSKSCKAFLKKRRKLTENQEEVDALSKAKEIVNVLCWYCNAEKPVRRYLYEHRIDYDKKNKYFCSNYERQKYVNSGRDPVILPSFTIDQLRGQLMQLKAEEKVRIETEKLSTPFQTLKKVSNVRFIPCVVCGQCVPDSMFDSNYRMRTGLDKFACSDECVGRFKQQKRRAQLGLS